MINSLKISKNQILNGFVLLIACTIIFRKLCTILILIFFVYSLFNFKYFYKKDLKPYVKYILIISIPLLLEILFFWNNNSLLAGTKFLEKTVSCLLFPLLIISHYKALSFLKILKAYAVVTIVTIVVSLVLFRIFDPLYFHKYMTGVDLYEMGYVFSNFIGPHAPALNMYVSFIATVFLYFFLEAKNQNQGKKVLAFYFVFLLVSFGCILVINTRVAMVAFVLNAIILFNDIKIELRKKLIIVAVGFVVLAGTTKIFIDKFPFMIEKYTTQVFGNLDKVGHLDELDDPQSEVYSSLVTRLSIWKGSSELAKENLLIGLGSSDAQEELRQYFKNNHQLFLSRYNFFTHNQFLNFLLRFGIVGFIGCFIYLCYPFFLGMKGRNILFFCFFLNFMISNLMDDYLLKFDGIVYSAFWFSIFTADYVLKKEPQQLKASLTTESL